MESEQIGEKNDQEQHRAGRNQHGPDQRQRVTKVS
jgi:hypothetical protein